MPGSNKASQPAGPVPDPVPVHTTPVLRPSITCQQTTLQLESRRADGKGACKRGLRSTLQSRYRRHDAGHQPSRASKGGGTGGEGMDGQKKVVRF